MAEASKSDKPLCNREPTALSQFPLMADGLKPRLSIKYLYDLTSDKPNGYVR